jgi:hypothetical protein
MIKRIQELAEQAGFSKDKYDLYWDDDANAEGVDLEKFAELIIIECAEIALREEHDPYECIKKHFGVEE